MHHGARHGEGNSGRAGRQSRGIGEEVVDMLKDVEISGGTESGYRDLAALRLILGSSKRVRSDDDYSLSATVQTFFHDATATLDTLLQSASHTSTPSEEAIDAFDGALYNIKSAAAAFCVIGDFDSAFRIFDTFAGTPFERHLRCDFSTIKASVSASKEELISFFASIGDDPDFSHLRAGTAKAVLSAQEKGEEIPQFPRGEFRKMVNKHLGVAEIPQEHIEGLGTFFTDGFALAIMDAKHAMNELEANCFVQGVTGGRNGFPTVEGFYAALEAVPGQAADIAALEAVDFFGRYPHGKFTSTDKIHSSKETAGAVRDFSKAIVAKAAELARDAGRKVIEEADVVKAYDLVENGGKPKVQEEYCRLKAADEIMTALAASPELSDEQLNLGLLLASSVVNEHKQRRRSK